MGSTHLSLTGLIVRDGRDYTSVCPELDVASQGRTIREARRMLRDAVSGYLQVCLDSNLPYLRPVPSEEDPRRVSPQLVVLSFRMRVDLVVKVRA